MSDGHWWSGLDGDADRPSSPALWEPQGLSLSHEGLSAAVAELADVLRGLGLGPNRRVVLGTADRMVAAVGFLAVSTVCGCAPLDVALTATELEQAMARIQPDAVIVAGDGAETLANGATGMGLLTLEVQLTEAGRPATAVRSEGRGLRSVGAEGFDHLALLVSTSGTTGQPKLVLLSRGNLATSTAAIAASLQLDRRDCGLNVMPLFHVHGLIAGLLAPLWSGGSVAVAPHMHPRSVLDLMSDERVTWLTAVPTIHHALASEAARRPGSYPGLRFLRSSSAPLPPTLMARLESTFGVPVLEAYGMSEASHQIACNPLPPAARKAGSVGLATSTEIDVLDESGHSLAAGVQGEVVIRGEGVLAQYDPPDPAAFVRGWLRTGDLGVLDEDGYLHLRGRIKEQINRGGQKVFPREIEEVLLRHPAVREAAAFALPHPSLGEHPAAAVVLEPSTSIGDHELRQWAAKELAPYKLPTPIVFLDALPKGRTGKLQRSRLPELIDAARAATAAPSGPGDVAITELCGLWAAVLELDEVSADDEFTRLGGDSLCSLVLQEEVWATFGVELPADAIFAQGATPRGMAALIATLSSRAERPPIATPSAQGVPLAAEQKEALALEQLAGDASVLNGSQSVRLAGSVDTDALQMALDRLLERHDALRTSLRLTGANPSIRSPHEVTVQLRSEDLRGIAPAGRERALEAAAVAAGRIPLDAASGRTFSATLIRVSAGDDLLVLTSHHVISDAWSRAILLRDLVELYAAAVEARPTTLPDPAPQHWQLLDRQTATETATDRDSYWHDTLHAVPPLELPADRPAKPERTFVGGQVTMSVPPKLAVDVQRLAQEQRATPFMVLLAAFGTLLGRYSASEQLVVGCPVAGRPVGFRDAVGLFMKLLPIRLDLFDDPTFSELLQRTKSSLIEGYAHQDAASNRSELAGRFQAPVPVTFQLREDPAGRRFEGGGLIWTAEDLDLGISRLPLEVALLQQDDDLSLSIQFNTDLFDRATIERMARHYLTLLEGATASAHWRLSELPLLTSEEEARIEGWAGSSSPVEDVLVAQMFEAQVDRTPHDPAAECDGETLTYVLLDEAANRLAHALRDRGVRPGAIVAICLERNVALLVAVLAVLKTGAAYMGIEPACPLRRVQFMLEDSEASTIITTGNLSDRFTGTSAELVSLDSEENGIAVAAPTRPLREAALDDPGSVFYTSGSTGTPKAVLVPHRATANLIRWAVRTHSRVELARVAATSTVSFDASPMEMLAPLCVGGTAVILRDALTLVDTDADVTFLLATPSATRELLRAGRLPPTLRVLHLAGERVSRTLVDRLHGLRHDLRLINGYGPTEATTYATTAELNNVSGDSVPIGRPLPNVVLRVLDAHLRLVPVGVTGELLIGGVGVALGYVGRPDLTADRFVQDPYDQGRRLYRTGDYVKWRPDGQLDFVGRRDRQAKVRGYRVEPEEVDALLAALPEVDRVLTVAEPTDEEGCELVSYLVSRPGTLPTSSALRAALGESLPDYMIPTRFLLVEGISYTASGKVDITGLRQGGRLVPTGAGVSVARPAGELEHQLIAAFSRILGRVDLTRDDDFFDAGGDSLAAVELWVAIEEDFGVRVALSDFATTCTPSHLAAVLTRGEGKPDLGSRVHATKPAVYCVHLRPAWIGHWLVLASQLVEFRVEGVLSQPLDRGSVEVTTIEAMARGGVDRLLASRPPSQFVLCGHSMGGAVAVEMSRLLGEMGQPPACVVLLDPTRPFKHRQLVRAARFAKLSTRGKAQALTRKANWVFRPARADPLLAIYPSYRPSPINGRLIVVEASDTVTVWGSSVDWWTRHLGRSLETLSVDGDHVTMVSNPRVAELIASIPLD